MGLARFDPGTSGTRARTCLPRNGSSFGETKKGGCKSTGGRHLSLLARSIETGWGGDEREESVGDVCVVAESKQAHQTLATHAWRARTHVCVCVLLVKVLTSDVFPVITFIVVDGRRP